jgi:hypothetical protein
MNPDKWKSVVVPIESYRVLKEMAAKERRTLSGQFTLLLEQVTGKDIPVGEETPKKKKA